MASQQRAVDLQRILICIIVLAAFLARLWALEAQSIWWDEAMTLHLASAELGELLADRAAHVHPPLYFLLQKGWLDLVGVSVLGVRFVSVWFNLLLVPVAYRLGSRWLGRRVGLVSAVLMASSPLYIVYSQEARVYALLPLVYLILLGITERLADSPAPGHWSNWFLLSVVEIAGVHLHYVLVFAVLYGRIRLLIRVRRSRRQLVRWLISGAGSMLVSLPWAIAVGSNWRAVAADVSSGDPFVEAIPAGGGASGCPGPGLSQTGYQDESS